MTMNKDLPRSATELQIPNEQAKFQPTHERTKTREFQGNNEETLLSSESLMLDRCFRMTVQVGKKQLLGRTQERLTRLSKLSNFNIPIVTPMF